MGGADQSSRAKVVVALGPTPGYEIWEKLQAIRAEIPAGVTVLSVRCRADAPLPDSDFELLAAKHPGDG